MIRFLVQRWVPNADEIHNPQVRKSYGVLGAVLGIICNSVLFLLKLGVGVGIHSIAVISDAFNNLTDMASSLITAAGSVVSGRRPDSGHPYGHGRAEYIAALIMSMLILLFGAELLKNSVIKIFQNHTARLSPVTTALLLLSILVKVWMWSYNRYLGQRIDSAVLLAAAKDSRNDAIATGVVVLGAVLSPWIPLPMDGILGVLVSCLILIGGVQIAKEVIDKLMGESPDTALRESIEAMVLEEKMILGMHDLMVHDYGPGRKIASVHAEVPQQLSLLEVHTVIDRIEQRILRELQVDIVIHMDPVPVLPEQGQEI